MGILLAAVAMIKLTASVTCEPIPPLLEALRLLGTHASNEYLKNKNKNRGTQGFN